MVGEYMRNIILLIWKVSKLLFLTLIIISIISGLITPVIIRKEEEIINAIELFLLDYNAWLDLLSPFLVLMIAYFGSSCLPICKELLNERVAKKLDLVLHQQIFKKMQEVKYQYVEDRNIIDLCTRINRNLDHNVHEIINNIYDLITSLISATGFFVIICSVSIGSSVVFIILFVALLFFADRSAKNFYKLNQHFTETERRVVYFDTVENTKPYAHEKKLFGFTDFINEMRSSFLMLQRNAMRKYDYKYGLTFGMIETAGYICSILLMLSMLIPIAKGKISVGLFISVSHAAINRNLTIQNRLRTVLNQLMEQQLFWKEYYQFLNLPNQCGKSSIGQKLQEGFEYIEFRNVSFQYPNGPKVLENISFRLEKGKHYALVGENGSGKSTIIKLLLRLYDVDTGEILLNGKNINSFNTDDLYNTFSTVFQDFGKYYISIRDNVTFGEKDSCDKLKKVLQQAKLSNKIDSLPEGMSTKLGEIYENSMNLSGGEWQRLAFARALYKNAPVILLDEPTSSLDPIAENEMYNQFRMIACDKTALFITHRLASAKMADEIFVINNGQIVERGSHDELLATHGLYEKMFNSQKKWYAEEVI